jgi:hydrogenase-4 component F
MALGFGFGGPLGIAGALYHMLGHSLNKSLMFFGAGNVTQVFNSKRIGRVRYLNSVMPVTGLLWLAGAVAITGAPPFGLFLSEVTILRAGLLGPNAWAVFVMLVLLIVIFVGFLNHFRAMYFGANPRADDPPPPLPPPRHISLWCLLPMWLALVPLLVLGLWWPEALTQYFGVIAEQLSAAHTAGTLVAGGPP